MHGHRRDPTAPRRKTRHLAWPILAGSTLALARRRKNHPGPLHRFMPPVQSDVQLSRLARQMMLAPLRLRRLWLSLGALLVAVVASLSLSPFSFEIPVKQGDKYGHLFAYATLMFWFSQIYSTGRARISLACGLIAMGVGLEYLQLLTEYRTFDVRDMIADALGVGVGWGIAPPRSPHLLRSIEWRWRNGW
jgi:VanZ family protein